MASTMKSLTLNEILEELEKKVESEGSDEEEDNSVTIVKEKVDTCNVYISPPDDGRETDEDSGEENNVEMDNLPRSHLLAEAVLSEIGPNIPDNEAKGKSTRPRKTCKLRQWVKEDIQGISNMVQYPYNPTSAHKLRTPCEIFELFIDVEIIDLMTKETVRYAINKGDHTFRLTCGEMKAFLGILIVSGYNTVPRRRLYWERAPDTHNEFIASSMRRDRFEEIMKYLHVADNNNLDTTDKYAKVRPLLGMLNQRFLSFGEALGANCISIDESMIPYFGRHPTKQFIRGKPIRWGYKAWVSANPLGYAYFIDLYQGRQAKDVAAAGEYRKTFGLGGEVILNMLDKLQNAFDGHTFSLYFDNYFTSVKLVEEIDARGHGATGTLRSNRTEKCPFTCVKSFEKKARGSVEYFRNNDAKVVVTRWNDNGVVTIASNQHSVSPMGSDRRFSMSEGKHVNIPVPKLIKEYNSNMGGVDRLDQNVSSYRAGIRGKKWYFPIISYLLQVCMNNAWLFARKGGYSNDLLAFTRSVAQDILKSHGIPSKHPGRSKTLVDASRSSTNTRTDNIGHNIVKVEPPRRRRCKQCNSQTYFSCSKCQVGLHQKCSMAYHEE